MGAKKKAVGEGSLTMGQRLTGAGEQHKYLSSKIQLLLEKITAVTEIGHYAHHSNLSDSQRATLLSAAIWSLDRSDEWWREQEGLSVKKWAERISAAYCKANIRSTPGVQSHALY